ncbi:MAG: hypothetical protein AAGU75_21685, partial [Bacillota bacterium]
MGDFYGYPTRHLSSRFLELDCLATAGPRIVRLNYQGSPNLFAELPNISVSTPYGDFHYMGGHRLWHAPESMPRSYIPDNDGLTLFNLPDGLILNGKTEPATGIHKCIEIHLNPDQPTVILIHTLTNEGLWEMEVSPWPLTMFRLGGIVILPTQVVNDNQEEEDLLPNRHFSLWPYSHINDPRLRLEDEFILLKAKPDLPPFKIGTFTHQGWIAYWLDGVLFRKSFDVCTNLTYPDFNCNVETYCDSDFVELESLAPFAKLAPGKSVCFTETWQVYDSLEQDFLPKKLMEQLQD